MKIFPAVDIHEGKAVRLKRGDFLQKTVYYDNAVDAAKRWEAEGAQYLHVVDLEGALLGEPKNVSTIEEIVSSTSLKVQAGGGLRSEEAVDRIMNAGADRVVLGTSIIKDPVLVSQICRKYDDRVVAAIDIKNGKVALQGWSEEAEVGFVEVVHDLEYFGVRHVLYTDISKDGMREGVDIPGIKKVLDKLFYPVIISGGVGSIEDIKALKSIEDEGIEGVILGTSIYEGSIDLREALRIAD